MSLICPVYHFTMHSKSLLDLPPLDQILDPSPLTVPPETPILKVMHWMRQGGCVRSRAYGLPLADAPSAVHPRPSSCVIVVEPVPADGSRFGLHPRRRTHTVLGIFTERDVVRLVAAERNLDRLSVAEVMTSPVISLNSAEVEDVLTVLQQFRQHRIRHLPIVDDKGQLLGVITQDRIRQVLHPSHLLRLRTVAEVMTAEVMTASPRASVLQVAQLMAAQDLSCCVIVEPQARSGEPPVPIPVGIVTERDIVQLRLQQADLGQISVEAVMSSPPLTVRPIESLWVAHQTMQVRSVRRLVVVDETGALRGLLTQTDILQAVDLLALSSLIQLLQHQVEEQTVQLQQVNQTLQQEILHRQEVEAALRQAQQALELRVGIRTAELIQANGFLQQESDERKRIEAELHQREYQWQALFDNALDAIAIADDQGYYIDVNPAACELFGVSREALLHSKLLDFADPSLDVSGVWEAFLAQGRMTGEFRLFRPDGTIRETEFAAVANFLPHRHLSILRDVTEQKQLEKQFYRAQRLESLGTLAGGIAHDLNNVFTPILAIAQLLPLKVQGLDTRTQDMLKALEDCSRRGADLVKQILTFARGTEGNRISLQAGHLLLDVAKIVAQTFPKSIEIERNVTPTNLWLVSADPTHLHQVFMNLAVNARDAMPNGGTLTLAAENRYIDAMYARINLDAHAGPYVVITVSDTGMGIPPELLDRIFDPFFTTKEVGKGTGLGLSTVLGIVKNHGGFVKVWSEVGRGTEFQIYLPAIEQSLANLASEESSLPRGAGERILIVDDEAIVRRTTQTLLEEYGYQTLLAQDGIEAIALFAEHKGELAAVLIDVMMPNMDGSTAIRALKRMHPQVRILASSGLAVNSQLVGDAGADAFLPKPYTAQTLLGTLETLLRREQPDA